MKELFRSHSLSYLQGLQVSLEANGIRSTLLDEQSISYMGFAGQVRLVILDDADYDKAISILREIQASAPKAEGSSAWRVQRWGCLGLVAGFGLLVAGGSVAKDELTALGYGLFGGAMAVFAISLAIILFAPRRNGSTRDKG